MLLEGRGGGKDVRLVGFEVEGDEVRLYFGSWEKFYRYGECWFKLKNKYENCTWKTSCDIFWVYEGEE